MTLCNPPALTHKISAAITPCGPKALFTAGKFEIHAWTIHEGKPGPTAAGVIHTVFEKGYARAEVHTFDLKNTTPRWL